MIVRVFGALIRALLVVLVIMLPASMVSGGTTDLELFSLAFAIVAGSVIFVEYAVESPAILEFRYATPYNRYRLLVLVTIALVLARGLSTDMFVDGATGGLAWFANVSTLLFGSWPSPVHFLTEAIGHSSQTANGVLPRLASTGLFAAIIAAMFFGLFLWAGRWPLTQFGFNLWPNMPSFNMRAGERAATRMMQVALLSFALAILLPYILPLFVRYGREGLGIVYANSKVTIYWLVFLWVAIPAMALLRAISLVKLAFLAENLRKLESEDSGS